MKEDAQWRDSEGGEAGKAVGSEHAAKRSSFFPVPPPELLQAVRDTHDTIERLTLALRNSSGAQPYWNLLRDGAQAGEFFDDDEALLPSPPPPTGGAIAAAAALAPGQQEVAKPAAAPAPPVLKLPESNSTDSTASDDDALSSQRSTSSDVASGSDVAGDRSPSPVARMGRNRAGSDPVPVEKDKLRLLRVNAAGRMMPRRAQTMSDTEPQVDPLTRSVSPPKTRSMSPPRPSGLSAAPVSPVKPSAPLMAIVPGTSSAAAAAPTGDRAALAPTMAYERSPSMERVPSSERAVAAGAQPLERAPSLERTHSVLASERFERRHRRVASGSGGSGEIVLSGGDRFELKPLSTERLERPERPERPERLEKVPSGGDQRPDTPSEVPVLMVTAPKLFMQEIEQNILSEISELIARDDLSASPRPFSPRPLSPRPMSPRPASPRGPGGALRNVPSMSGGSKGQQPIRKAVRPAPVRAASHDILPGRVVIPNPHAASEIPTTRSLVHATSDSAVHSMLADAPQHGDRGRLATLHRMSSVERALLPRPAAPTSTDEPARPTFLPKLSQNGSSSEVTRPPRQPSPFEAGAQRFGPGAPPPAENPALRAVPIDARPRALGAQADSPLSPLDSLLSKKGHRRSLSDSMVREPS